MRVIPVLLLHKGSVVKSLRFKNYKYIGDPINAVRIFNQKEVDEIAIIDIDASREGRAPDFDLISRIAGEAFMPLSYGGGISDLEEVKKLLNLGVEKVILNRSAHLNVNLIQQIASVFGSQSVVVSIDVKKNWLGKYSVCIENGNKSLSFSPEEAARKAEQAGAGEIILNSVEKDGTFEGYDLTLVKKISDSVSVPVIALGGAGKLSDLVKAREAGASAVAAGSMFVFIGNSRESIMINYPPVKELKSILI